MGTTISGGFTSTVSGFESDIFIAGGGTLHVAAGGTAEVVFVNSGGSAVVFSGGSIDSTVISGGGAITVSAGGLLNGATDSGLVIVGAHGLAETVSAFPHGVLIVSSGGSATGAAIDGGSETVLAGGVDVGVNVFSGTLLVSSGGVASNTSATLNGSAVISAGGVESVTAFGSASGVTLLAGAGMTIGSAGVATATQVQSGGTLAVSAGGELAGTQIGSAATVTVAAGGTESGNIITVGGSETVLSGGTAVATQIGSEFVALAGAVLTVASGGVASGSLLAYGSLVILSGGTAVDPENVASGSIVVSSGGVLSQTQSGRLPLDGVTLEAGGSIVLPIGGKAVNVLVESGATLDLTSGQELAQGTIANGGLMLLGTSAIESGSTVLLGGSETVQSGGVTLATLVSGVMTVASGGIASGTEIASGGSLVVSNGGTAIDTNKPLAFGGGVSAFSGGTTTIASGGQEIVSGSGAGVTIGSGGQMVIRPGAVATSTDIEAGGSLMVSSGGTAESVTLNAGGTLDIAAGGVVAAALVLPGATLTLSAGAGALLPVVSGGGVLVVSAGAAARGIIVGVGGQAIVQSGAGVEDAGVSGAGSLTFEAGAVVSGGLAFGGFGGDIVISGTPLPNVSVVSLGAGDTIDLPGIAYDAAGAITSAGSVLSFSENGQTYTFDLTSAAIGTNALSLAPDQLGGTLIEVACYAAGTRIATPSGAAPVEALRPGDTVLAWQDGAWRPAPVRWVGQRRVDLTRHPQPLQAAPIRIAAGAIADGVPARDLRLSPDHAVLLDGALFQAQALLNGASVTQEMPAHITYCHIELDRHALLLAEGLAAESYLDSGNRALFAGEAGARPLHPDLASAAAWDRRACAKLHLTGAPVAAAHARVLLRAIERGYDVIADPALRIEADGTALLAFTATAGVWEARLPAGTCEVRLMSRSFVPLWYAEPDRRRLGIAVAGVTVGGRRLKRGAFAAGWYAQERQWRWTDGVGVLRLPPLRRAAMLRLTLAAAGARYWCEPAIGRGVALRRRSGDIAG